MGKQIGWEKEWLKGKHFLKSHWSLSFRVCALSVYEFAVFVLSSSYIWLRVFPSGSMVKNLPTTRELQEKWVRSLSREDPLEEGTAAHSRILAWINPWTEEPGGLQFMGSRRVGYDWSDLACTAHLVNSADFASTAPGHPEKLSHHQITGRGFRCSCQLSGPEQQMARACLPTLQSPRQASRDMIREAWIPVETHDRFQVWMTPGYGTIGKSLSLFTPVSPSVQWGWWVPTSQCGPKDWWLILAVFRKKSITLVSTVWMLVKTLLLHAKDPEPQRRLQAF